MVNAAATVAQTGGDWHVRLCPSSVNAGKEVDAQLARNPHLRAAITIDPRCIQWLAAAGFTFDDDADSHRGSRVEHGSRPWSAVVRMKQLAAMASLGVPFDPAAEFHDRFVSGRHVWDVAGSGSSISVPPEIEAAAAAGIADPLAAYDAARLAGDSKQPSEEPDVGKWRFGAKRPVLMMDPDIAMVRDPAPYLETLPDCDMYAQAEVGYWRAFEKVLRPESVGSDRASGKRRRHEAGAGREDAIVKRMLARARLHYENATTFIDGEVRGVDRPPASQPLVAPLINTGFLYMQPTAASKLLMSDWLIAMDLYRSQILLCDDQCVLNSLLFATNGYFLRLSKPPIPPSPLNANESAVCGGPDQVPCWDAVEDELIAAATEGRCLVFDRNPNMVTPAWAMMEQFADEAVRETGDVAAWRNPYGNSSATGVPQGGLRMRLPLTLSLWVLSPLLFPLRPLLGRRPSEPAPPSPHAPELRDLALQPPFMVHYNWLRHLEDKREEMRERGHWLLDDSESAPHAT